MLFKPQTAYNERVDMALKVAELHYWKLLSLAT